MPDHNKEHGHQVLEMVRDVIKFDEELRVKYKIENKFRFVRERLQTLLEKLEKESKSKEKVTKEIARGPKENEIVVYVYLYNAHGANLKSWQNMLVSEAFYEYSVNRPIYAEKKYLDLLLRSKTNKSQHAFMSVAVPTDDIIQTAVAKQDTVGNPVIRVKEGSLHFDALILFTHNGHDYKLSPEGELTLSGRL